MELDPDFEDMKMFFDDECRSEKEIKSLWSAYVDYEVRGIYEDIAKKLNIDPDFTYDILFNSLIEDDGYTGYIEVVSFDLFKKDYEDYWEERNFLDDERPRQKTQWELDVEEDERQRLRDLR